MIVTVKVFVQAFQGGFPFFAVHVAVPDKHAQGLVTGELLNRYLIDSCPPHVGVEGVPQIMEPIGTHSDVSTPVDKLTLHLHGLDWLSLPSEF